MIKDRSINQGAFTRKEIQLIACPKPNRSCTPCDHGSSNSDDYDNNGIAVDENNGRSCTPVGCATISADCADCGTADRRAI